MVVGAARLSSARRHSTRYHTRACGLVVAQAVFCSLAPRNDVATAAGGAIYGCGVLYGVLLYDCVVVSWGKATGVPSAERALRLCS